MPLYEVRLTVHVESEDFTSGEAVLVEAETEEGALLALSLALKNGHSFPGSFFPINDRTIDMRQEVMLSELKPQVVVTNEGVEVPEASVVEANRNVVYLFGKV